MIKNYRAIMSAENKWLPWLVCGTGMLFYFYNFFLRVSPSVMHSQLMHNFHINAYQFGTLSAFYYYGYTPMQLPVGALYDRFGIKSVQFVAILIALMGLLIFISADSYSFACLGRFFIGLGGAFAYVGVLKLASNWLPANRFALAAGLTTTLGMAAAMFADTYLNHIVDTIGYQNSLHSGIIMGVILAVIVLLFVKNHPPQTKSQDIISVTMRDVFSGFNLMIRNRQMWLIGIIGCLTYLPSTVFLDLWGIPFLESTYHLSAEKAGLLISNTLIGWIVGGPLIGWISDHIKRRRLPLILSYVSVATLFATLFYVPGLSLLQISIVLFLIGVACSAHPLCFTIGKENNHSQFAGISVAFCNCLTMLGGIIFQPVVGRLLDLHAHLTTNVHPVYSGNDFVYSLSIIPIGVGIAVILSLFINETYCEQVQEDYTLTRS